MQFPKAWLETKVKASTKVNARIDMSADVLGKGLCPDCRQPMTPALASDYNVMTCHGCRIALPVKD